MRRKIEWKPVFLSEWYSDVRVVYKKLRGIGIRVKIGGYGGYWAVFCGKSRFSEAIEVAKRFGDVYGEFVVNSDMTVVRWC